MKYDFHVGDYVETVGGFVGWICQTRDDSYIWVANKDIASCSYRIPEALKYFNRIGQYDFTKKDEGKIELLAEEYIKSFPIYKTTTTGNDSEWRSIDIGAVGKKINELVEAVNRLEEKVR
mgnify:CR=1 FL=1